jgi:predicted transcriptional regulator
MDSGFLMKRRGPLIITVEILKAAKNGVGKTQVLYYVGLSYSQIAKYLEFLTTKGFIEKNGSLYKTTEKGLELIEEFESSPLTRSIVAT